jgi:hypothetical protein
MPTVGRGAAGKPANGRADKAAGALHASMRKPSSNAPRKECLAAQAPCRQPGQLHLEQGPQRR